MPTRTKFLNLFAKRALMISGLSFVFFQIGGAQSNDSKTMPGAKNGAPVAAGDPASPQTSDVPKILKTAAEALGLARWSGVGGQRLPEVDVVNTMEIWGSGTTYGPSPSNKAGEPGPSFKTEYHAALGYNPPAMRVEMTRTASGASAPNAAASQRTIEVVRENYAWDESEIGAGLIPGHDIATPAMAAAKSRFLQLWILPYGVIKAAVAAGERTKVSTADGKTVLSFPLSGQLAGVMVKATLDAQNEVASVETRTENPALSDLNTETEYSDYKDHGEIATDVMSPGHIVRKQGGHPVLDIRIKTLDANNPYLVFPVPENIKKAAAQ